MEWIEIFVVSYNLIQQSWRREGERKGEERDAGVRFSQSTVSVSRNRDNDEDNRVTTSVSCIEHSVSLSGCARRTRLVLPGKNSRGISRRIRVPHTRCSLFSIRSTEPSLFSTSFTECERRSNDRTSPIGTGSPHGLLAESKKEKSRIKKAGTRARCFHGSRIRLAFGCRRNRITSRAVYRQLLHDDEVAPRASPIPRAGSE